MTTAGNPLAHNASPCYIDMYRIRIPDVDQKVEDVPVTIRNREFAVTLVSH